MAALGSRAVDNHADELPRSAAAGAVDLAGVRELASRVSHALDDVSDDELMGRVGEPCGDELLTVVTIIDEELKIDVRGLGLQDRADLEVMVATGEAVEGTAGAAYLQGYGRNRDPREAQDALDIFCLNRARDLLGIPSGVSPAWRAAHGARHTLPAARRTPGRQRRPRPAHRRARATARAPDDPTQHHRRHGG
jgi:hypothetical protein